jgi:hypothetical protein
MEESERQREWDSSGIENFAAAIAFEMSNENWDRDF